MTTTHRTRALARKPSTNPAWATLESMAVDYLALHPAPEPPAVDPRREQLREDMLKRLMGTWVQMLADEVVDEASGRVGDAGSGDATLPSLDIDGAGSEAPEHRLLRRDSALEAVFRAEAMRLARRHGNAGLAQAFGGVTNLAANAQQDFAEQRLLRFGRRQQTLLSGLLSQWDPERGSLYTFISRMASSFLIDMARQHFGQAAAKPDQADKQSEGATAEHAPTPQPRQRRARRGAGEGDGHGGDAAPGGQVPRSHEATPGEWVMAQAMANAQSEDGQADAQDWLDAHTHEQTPAHEDSPQDRLEAKQALLQASEMRQALRQAVRALPDELRLLFEMELLKDGAGLSDDEVAKRMGWGSRNTLIKHRQRLHQVLRQQLDHLAR